MRPQKTQQNKAYLEVEAQRLGLLLLLPRGTAHVHQLTGWQGVLVEALVPERTLAGALLEVLAVRRVARLLVVVDQLVLVVRALDPDDARTDKVGRDATGRAAALDFVLKVLRLAPRPDALEAEDVVAVGQDAEALLPARLLQDHLQTDAADLVLRALDRKRVLHVQLVLLDALGVVLPALFRIGRIQAELATQLAQFAVLVRTSVQHTAPAGLVVRTERRIDAVPAAVRTVLDYAQPVVVVVHGDDGRVRNRRRRRRPPVPVVLVLLPGWNLLRGWSELGLGHKLGRVDPLERVDSERTGGGGAFCLGCGGIVCVQIAAGGSVAAGAELEEFAHFCGGGGGGGGGGRGGRWLGRGTGGGDGGG